MIQAIGGAVLIGLGVYTWRDSERLGASFLNGRKAGPPVVRGIAVFQVAIGTAGLTGLL
jgi:hypothetical protein